MKALRRNAWQGIVTIACVVGMAAALVVGVTRSLPVLGSERAAPSGAAALEKYLPRFHYPEKMCLPAPGGDAATASPAASAICRLPDASAGR